VIAMDYTQFTLNLAGIGGIMVSLLMLQAGLWQIRKLIVLAKGMR